MRIRTFGGLWIEGGPSRALGPRRLALLALVAAGGRRGTSRDRVLGILWPEAGEEQARHALSQALYSLRRDTGRDWIAAAADLRLDPSVTSDVGDLHDALAAEDADRACALHTGEFLDGFYLPEAPEFERWVEEERARFRAEVARAAERGAARAEREGDHAVAVRLWTRLTELDPMSARHAAGLMRALVAAGDRASALAHARQHEALVRRELEAEVDPAITRLVAEIKAAPTQPPPPSLLPSPPTLRALPPSPSQPSLASPPPAEPPPAEPPSRRTVPAVLAVLAVIAVLAGLAGLAARNRRPRPAPILAVGSIRVPEQGDTSSLGPVLRDMLATSLGGLEGLRVVANSRLVELTPPSAVERRGAITAAAQRAGATEVIEGELATEAGAMVLSLRRVGLAQGEVRKGYVVRAGDRYALVDSAAASIARDLGVARPTHPIGALRTTSPEAYLLYNEGLRAFYGFDGPGGYRLMTAALERDSTFAMAAYYAWIFGQWTGDHRTRQQEMERVKRLAPRTIERERLLLQAEVAAREAPISVAAAIAETLTVRYPADPDGHILLGNLREEQGDWAGAIASHRRAFLLDSAAGNTTGPYCRMCVALSRMSSAYLGWDSAAAAERVARRVLALRPDNSEMWVGLVEPLLRQGRRAEAVAALERSRRPDVIPGYERFALHRDLIRWGRHGELDRALAAELVSASTEVRGNARWLLLLSLRDRGRLREARALALESRIPGSGERVQGHGPELVLSATMLSALGRPDSAARLLHAEARRVHGAPEYSPATRARDGTWRLTLAGTAYAQAGDTMMVRRIADSIEVLGLESTFGRDPRLHHYLRGLLLQAAGRHAEAVAAFRRSLYSLTDGYTEINLALARSLLALGRPDEAVAVLRPAIHGGVDGSNTYTSRTELHEAMAQAFEQAGRRDSAVAHWGAVERAWRGADPEFRERHERARAAARQ